MARWIEQATVDVLRAAARTAVEKHNGYAAALTELFDVEPMPVANVEHARVEGAEMVVGGGRIDH